MIDSTSPPTAIPRLVRAWLLLGIAALAIAGVLAILLVLARTPYLQSLFTERDFFRSALVVHVDLSVLIWFIAFAGIVWTLAGRGRLRPLGWAGLGLVAAGTLVMAVSPFLAEAKPLLNNYVPVLDQRTFLLGLALCGGGFALTVFRALIDAWPRPAGALASELAWGSYFALIAGAVSLVAFLWTLAAAPAMSGTARYELLFWGPGHTLQFQHGLLLLVAWWWLLKELGAPPAIGVRGAIALFALAGLPVLSVPLIYAWAPPASPEHMSAFVRLMQYGHAFSLPAIAVIVLALLRLERRRSPAATALIASVVLFAAGGVLGFLIHGVNVVIPAHYHGSIVGVTLAFMGLTYLLLPQLGYRAVTSRAAAWQPYVYGGGQLLHILGLAWSGGYGVQRKVAGAEQILSTVAEKTAMGMMGLGGFIAIIGGIMFVWICLAAMLKSRPPTVMP